MSKASFHILRVGLAITFLWIGILIFKQPEAWTGYVRPWVSELLPISIEHALASVAVLDILIGIFFLFDSFVWIAALIGSIHLVIVLAVSGITNITVRDIAILAGVIVLTLESFPFFSSKSILTRSKNSVINI